MGRRLGHAVDYCWLSANVPWHLLSSPPIPDELRLAAFLGGEQGDRDGLRQAGIVEAQAQVVLGIVVLSGSLPGVADAGVSDEHPEGRRILAGSVVIGDEPDLGVDGQRADGAGPAAVARWGKGADHTHGSVLRG